MVVHEYWTLLNPDGALSGLSCYCLQFLLVLLTALPSASEMHAAMDSSEGADLIFAEQ